jgi:uncharacterized damage-inducible protein DinB
MYEPIIKTYEAGGKKLRDAISGLTDAQIKSFPIPGTWSIQQIVVHLADSDAIWISRMKQMIAEERPLIMGYDESDFADRLHCNEQLAADAVAIFDLNRRQFTRVLRKLSPTDFDRKGIHSERGEIGVGESLKLMVGHLDHHLKFIIHKRSMLGNPVKE